MLGSPREKAETRKKLRAEARLAAEKGPEGVGLAALEQASSNLVDLFRNLAAQLAARFGRAAPRRKAAKDETPAVLTPPKLAKQLGVSTDKI